MIRGLMNTKSFSRLAFRALAVLATVNASAWAMARPNTDPNAPPPPAWTQWVPMLMLLAIFYFFLLRPQSKQRKERDTMLSNLKKGDRIATQSGFIAVVATVGPKYLEVKLSDELRVKMLRSGVSEVLPESAEAELSALSGAGQK